MVPKSNVWKKESEGDYTQEKMKVKKEVVMEQSDHTTHQNLEAKRTFSPRSS